MRYPIDEYTRKPYKINEKGEKILVNELGDSLEEITIPAYVNVKHATKKEATHEIPKGK